MVSFIWGHVSCWLILTALILSCTDVRLKTIEENKINVKSQGQFCISDPSEVSRYMKFLFVIDKSGSNSTTDNGGGKRSKNIETFVNENLHNNYYRYGMIAFEGDQGAQAYIYEDDPSTPTFTKDFKKIFDATKRIRGDLDGGNTPYKSALQAAYMAIKSDIENHPEELSSYMVFFVSDGQPTDIRDGPQLESLVQQIIDLSSNVHLSTAFYGNGGSRAIDLLNKMGTVYGKGKFINFESNTHWDFNELVVKPTHEPWQMKSFLVYNLNAGYCEDGSIDVDSDSDGMCDKDELRYDGMSGMNGKIYHFDPRKRFSEAGGFGDYFRWRELRYGEVIPSQAQCDDRSDEDHDLLTRCEESYIKNDRPSDKIPKNGDSKNPDTDRDGILDGIETFVYFTRSLGFAMDSFNLLRTNLDGEEQAWIQIAQHRNPLIRDLGTRAYDTHLEKTNEVSRDCYTFTQEILPLYSTLEVAEGDTLEGLEHQPDQNVVLVYYIQTPQSDPQGDGVLMYSLQKLVNDPLKVGVLGIDSGLKVQDGVFQQYVSPVRP